MEAHEEAESEAPQETMEVNPEYLKQLKDLDIPEEEARKALILTGNISAEEAAMFYFESLENHNLVADEYEMYYKMVFVVNMELPMGVGKALIDASEQTLIHVMGVSAQVGHAAIGLYQLLLKDSKTREMAEKWDVFGAKKVVLQGANAAHLMQLQALAISLDLPTYLVQDAGRTQIASGSHTVLGIMGEEENVNKVTGKLKLLN